MRHATILLFLFVSTACGTAFAQVPSPSRPAQNADELGMTCAKVLALPSTDYIAKYVAIDDSNVDGQLRGIGRYGKCYEARTDALAGSLARIGKGPSKTARADFAAFEAALESFTANAFAAEPPAPGTLRANYANLYEKQFRYLFYQEYTAKTANATKSAASIAKPAAPAAATPAPPAAGSRAATPPTAEERARSDADPVTQAKNRFGKLLEVLPDDQMHELHSAFGDVIGPHHISEATRLAVYRYAIFILEPPSAKPFAPPPF